MFWPIPPRSFSRRVLSRRCEHLCVGNVYLLSPQPRRLPLLVVRTCGVHDGAKTIGKNVRSFLSGDDVITYPLLASSTSYIVTRNQSVSDTPNTQVQHWKAHNCIREREMAVALRDHQLVCEEQRPTISRYKYMATDMCISDYTRVSHPRNSKNVACSYGIKDEGPWLNMS